MPSLAMKRRVLLYITSVSLSSTFQYCVNCNSSGTIVARILSLCVASHNQDELKYDTHVHAFIGVKGSRYCCN